jgi:transposase
MSEEKSRRRTPYPTEMRERAIRMVLDHQDEYSSQWAAIGSVAEKLSINRETLRLWVRRAETDEGKRPGLTTDERARMKALERENKELRRANEMAGSTGERNESCGMGSSQSREDEDARSPRTLECRAEATGIPTAATGLAFDRHRQGDRLHGTDGRSHGEKREAFGRRPLRLGTEIGIPHHSGA